MEQKKQPLITVITVCRNSAATIENTIQSVISQDYNQKEYIIIDGASSDDTLSVVSRFQEKINLVISEPDEGISDAFNKGIANAHGDLIVLVNADDVLLPETLTRVAEHYSEDVDVFACNVLMKDSETGFCCREVPSTDFPVMPFFRHVAHQGMFVSADCYHRFGNYDTAVRWPMDLDFLMRVSRGGGKFQYLDIDSAIFHSGGTTNQVSILRKRRDYLYIVKKNGGNVLQAWTFFLFLVMTQVAKKILNLFGKNFGQKLRYSTKI